MQQSADFSTFTGRFLWALERHPGNQSDLAKAIGASPAMVTQWKSGQTSQFDAVKVIRAAQFLDVDVEWLVLGEGNPERIRKTSLQMAQLFDDLPKDPRQQTLDFISYQVTKAEPVLTGEKAAHYHQMIESIIRDMKARNQ